MKNSLRGYANLAALTTSISCSSVGAKFPEIGCKVDGCLEVRLEKENKVKNEVAEKYAVLISGDIRARDMYDLSFSYQVLLENGFRHENIYIFDEDGHGTFIYPLDGIANKKNIKNLFSHLAGKIGEEDLLYVGITDHGDRNKDGSLISLPGSDVNEMELQNYLSKIEAGIIIVLADICHGGGFAERFSSGNFLGISPVGPEDLAYGDPEDTFTRHFMMAFRRPEKSDNNNDGKVSILEAFNYAKKHDPRVELGHHKPILRTNLDADEVYLGL